MTTRKLERSEGRSRLGTVARSYAKQAAKLPLERVTVHPSRTPYHTGWVGVELLANHNPGPKQNQEAARVILDLSPDAALELVKGILLNLSQTSAICMAADDELAKVLRGALVAIDREHEDARQVVAAVRDATAYHRAAAKDKPPPTTDIATP